MHCPTKLMVAQLPSGTGVCWSDHAHNGLPSGPPPAKMDGVNDIAHTGDVAQVSASRRVEYVPLSRIVYQL